MAEGVDYDSFIDVDQLPIEEGLVASSLVGNDTWEQQLVRKECVELSDEKRKQVIFTLLGLKIGNKLPWGAQTKLAKQVGVDKSTISKLFKKVTEAQLRGEEVDVSNKRKGHCGKKPKYDNNEEWLESAPLNLRGLVDPMLLPYTAPTLTFIDSSKKVSLKLTLNKIQRMKWVLQHIKPVTNDSKPTFVDMKHTIHIDEKWFNLNPGTRRFYMLPKEANPYRSTKHKNYSIKVMFMGVASRPLYDDEGHMIHDGKFGIFPSVFKERAKRTSKNRVAGTLETKVIPNITQPVMRDMMLNKVLPSIREKWPTSLSKDIIIQQDNATPHLSNDDPEFREAATQDGFNMVLVNQPPQSPDFNVLDLGLFRALQSLQNQAFPRSIDELIERVNEVYWNYDPTQIKYVWITLQYVMVEALKIKGGNNYKIPHIGKASLDRVGLLSDIFEVDQEIIDEAVAYLNENGEGQENQEIPHENMDIDPYV